MKTRYDRCFGLPGQAKGSFVAFPQGKENSRKTKSLLRNFQMTLSMRKPDFARRTEKERKSFM
ncbi:MAG: hypothetical protein AMJ53_17430 [Gammaproteobacteria bacterium SG8_11]|nr:MAG: hypothetical protein AMJ53_17430 [Gammaproteobacteria bacterium SG8_11]